MSEIRNGTSFRGSQRPSARSIHRTAACSLLLWGLLATVLPRGATAAELQPADGAAPLRLGWQKCEVARKPAVRLKKQPDYGSRNPCYIALRLGSGSNPVIVGALDESNGRGTQFDRLYLDTNNNRDLTDDIPIALTSNAAERTLAFDIQPVTVRIRYGDGSDRPMRVRLELRGSAAGGSPGDVAWTVMGCVDQHLEGRIHLGNRTNLLVGIYDASRGDAQPNGCFNDYEVDRLRVDMNNDGTLDEKTEDYPLSMALSLDGRLWDFSVDASGASIKTAPSALKTGGVRMRHATAAGATAEGEAELCSGRGLAFACIVAGDRETDLPEGEYGISSARMVATDGTGGLWKAAFALEKSFSVKRGKTAQMALGAPLKIEPSIHKGTLKPGNDICIAAETTGAGGEVYRDISIAGARMSPTVKIIDANDIVVATGNMEYG